MSFKKRFIFFICFILFGGAGIAHAEGKDTIKIGFPIQYGISYIDDDGNYAGYMVDYLEQLRLYTNLDYDFVMVDGDLNTQISKLLDMLIKGDIDMLGTMNRTEAMEELFLYPNHSYGTTYTALTVKEDSQKLLEEDYKNWNGMKIAVYKGHTARISQLEKYANLNGFTYELVECETLLEALNKVLDGQADATLQVDISIMDGFRTIAKFSPTPYYFALNKENKDLLQTINSAIYNMDKAYPYLQSELHDEYFDSHNKFMLSDEEKEYINGLEKVRVLFCEGNAPFQYVKDGKVKGLAVAFFDKFSKETGLQYEPVIVSSLTEGIKLVEEGKVDIVSWAATSSDYIALDGMRFSMPCFTSSTICVSSPQNSCSHNAEQFYTNAQNVLNELKDNLKQNARLDFYSVNYYLQKKVIYDNLKVDWSSQKNVSYSIGVTKNVSDTMIKILNHYINSLSETQIQNIVYRCMRDYVQYSLKEILYINKNLIIFMFILSGSIICIYYLYSRSKKAKDEIKLTRNKLQQVSCYDELTGSYNGTYFRKVLSKKCNERIPIILLALNLRNFKYINETYGVTVADEVLCRIKQCLESVKSDSEFFCRESADIFYMVLDDEPSSESLIERINSICKLIQTKCNEILGQYNISISCGVVFVAKSPEPYSPVANLNYMMAALAQSKKKKQDNICIYDEKFHKAEQVRAYVENNMELALKRGDFKLYLQPKVNLSNRCLAGAEALVRWQPKDRGMIYPDEFIPLFEENGFCDKLDMYMVEQVCKQIRFWLDNGLSPVPISVNQTRSLFNSKGYIERLMNITEKYGVSPKYITLEILESTSLDNFSAVNDCIKKLREKGFRISMDDFGSGYSSLNTLGKLKIDELKLDRLFLMDVAKDADGVQQKVMTAILSLAKKLNISTVAEGVETKESEQMIAELGCDYGQGYYYSRPISVSDFEYKYLKDKEYKF